MVLGLSNMASRPALPDADYAAWRTFVRLRCGLDFPESRRRVLTRAVRTGMRQEGFRDVGTYLAHLQDDALTGPAWPRLLALLVNHESRFFRHRPSFDALESVILPGLIAAKPLSGQRPWRLWSAGCSAGQEPYSMAMSIHGQVDIEPGQVEILATDISKSILTRARAGNYRPADLEPLTEQQLQRFTVQVNTPDGVRYAVHDHLRAMVTFRQHNLCDAGGLLPTGFDVIFCQNVLIYLDIDTRLNLVRRLINALHPGGFLVLGPAEIVGVRLPGTRSVTHPDTLIYQRIAQPIMQGAAS